MIAIRRIALCLIPLLGVDAAGQDGYRQPPKALVDCITAPPPPSVSVSPNHAWLVLVAREAMPSIAVQSRPILRIAGLRLDAATHGPQRGARSTGFTLVPVAGGPERAIEAPANADLGRPVWTADGRQFAFTNTTDDRIELWVADVSTAKARRIENVRLNAALGGRFGSAVSWMPDQQKLLCHLVAGSDQPPRRPAAPAAPIVQESSGVKAPVRTYQDLLTNEHDADLFEYYATTQLAVVDPGTGHVEKLGEPAMVSSASPSPDGSYLLVTRLQRPFSYLVTYGSFPQQLWVVDRKGRDVYQVADLPLADEVPIGGVLEGPRSVRWIPTDDHRLQWVEALDGGDPETDAAHRDRLMVHDPVVRMAPREWLRLQHRSQGVSFGPRGELALVSEFDRDTRQARTWKANPAKRDAEPTLLYERSTQDAYGNPGRPLTTVTPRGTRVLITDGDQLFFTGSGSSPDGDRPFLDRWNLATGDKERLFHCDDAVYEQVVAMLADDGSRLLVQRESKTEFPNYFVYDQTRGTRTPVTKMTDPITAMTEGIKSKLLNYERDDGIKLSGTLYTPPGYREGDRLPLLVWAYPEEFNSAKNAGQVRGSQFRYTRLSGTSPLLLTLAGYAVLNDAAMPVVGPVETANDNFVKQLVAGAKAAIDAAVAEGVADGDRAAIAGHSYGAFMTANLLAHSDLFRAGIARSGAYNRTLTPFGFQNERRTYWDAPEVYFAMSPFMHAPKIDEPLLLIHGEADNNSGTFPIQSQRLYHAIKGNGGTARLVMLPYESHGYRARESVLHCMAETVDWMDAHVKNAKSPGKAGPGDGQGDGGR